MLKRLYVHNYKCLVNFEINFDQDISLFLGANGSGKSTVFEVLAKLKRVILDEEKIVSIFDYSDTPRWLNEKSDIRFEFDIDVNSVIYKYSLVIGFSDTSSESMVKEEHLFCDNKAIIESKNGVSVFFDDIRGDLKSPIGPIRSSISRHGGVSADDFLKHLNELFIARINPYEMVSTISKTNGGIKTDFSNYAEWFAHLNEKNRRGISVFENAMRDILPGFDYFKIERAGQAKVLQVDFQDKANNKNIVSYYFNELSEGQKALISLYALVYCTPDNSIICIDEPENFLALPEIQPWFDTLYDQCAERGLQALLISHHPKLINLLANDSGYWFSRENNLTRIQKISAENESGLSVAELVELGWIYDE
ncbi:MAG: AAA family ATPase [Methylococcales bacterium]|nr:AAA family ATPase [Methylococcales bacterium]